jgi:hypothetical protein
VDEQLAPYGVIDPAPKGPSLRNALVQNISPGHTMAMNRAMARLAARTLQPENVVMHDCWLYLLACALGEVMFDPIPHAYYRQHSGNEEGYLPTKAARALRELSRLTTRDRSDWTRQAQALLATVGEQLSPANHELVRAFIDQRTLASRLHYLRRYGFSYQIKRIPLAAVLLYASGRYRQYSSQLAATGSPSDQHRSDTAPGARQTLFPIVAIVVTYNRKEMLRQCLDALLAQSHDNFDILLIDNASNDGTMESITDFRSNNRVRYFNTGENLGGAGGFNYGIRKAVEHGYECLWIMDDDCLPYPDALQELINADGQLNGDYGFLSSEALWTDGTPARMNIQHVTFTKKARLDDASFSTKIQ